MKVNVRAVFSIALFIICTTSIAQLQTSQWYFSAFTALNFNTSPPSPVTSSMNPSSRCAASMADSAGNLLFYTNGVSIWNKNHIIMSNGATVGPNTSFAASQAAIVFPKSGKKYYIFMSQYPFNSTLFAAPRPIRYCVVDMTAASGLGAVIQSTQSISPANVMMSTKLAGTRHCNGSDYWLLAHETTTNVGSQNFYAYRVTPDSVYTTPIISAVGTGQVSELMPTGPGGSRGLLKFSPNGRKVCTTFQNRSVELFDFDNATGQVSNVLQLESINSPTLIPDEFGPTAFGIEFSSDGNRLYISYLNEHPSICQYNLAASSPAAIIASKTIIAPDTFSYPGNVQPGVKALQLALDGKIYFAEPGLNSIGVISNPNALGIACNYSPHAVTLGTINANSNPITLCTSDRGLPSFISNYFEQKPALPPFNGSLQCGNATFTAPVLSAMAGYSVYSYQWNFADPVTGIANTSSLAIPNHLFSANGTYTVKLTLNYKCGADTLKQVVTVSGLPSVSVTAKAKICKGENALLNFAGATNYTLNGSAVSQTSISVQPTITTSYTVIGKDNSSGCQSLKVFTLTVSPCTDIDEKISEEIGLVVYPNPNEGVFKIKISQSTTIKIVDLSGRLIYNEMLQEGLHTRDLSELSSGLYILEAQNEWGMRQLKLVKH